MNEEELSYESEEWTLFTIPCENGLVQVTACKRCSQISLEQIFEGHRQFVRSGRDHRYHQQADSITEYAEVICTIIGSPAKVIDN